MSAEDGDWNAEWMRLSDRRAVVHDAAYWDRRARELAGEDRVSPYVTGFVAAMRLLPGESVLDVGCGSGALALPLARAGHHVTALDFSPGMLAALRRGAGDEFLGRVTTVRADWDDDWAAAGIVPAGVAVASRSLDVRDLRSALEKLDAFALRRVCVTLPADGLFYPELVAHEAVGRPYSKRGDRRLALKVLRQMGISPEVRLLDHTSAAGYESREIALASLSRLVAPADDGERRALERYVAEHVVEAKDERGRPVWRHDPPVTARWALLAWDKAGARGT